MLAVNSHGGSSPPLRTEKPLEFPGVFFFGGTIVRRSEVLFGIRRRRTRSRKVFIMLGSQAFVAPSDAVVSSVLTLLTERLCLPHPPRFSHLATSVLASLGGGSPLPKATNRPAICGKLSDSSSGSAA